MSVPAAFLTAVLISATTPLAIKWSGQNSNAIFASLARVAIALAVCFLVMMLAGKRLEWNRDARRVYFAAALGVFLCLLPVYWAVQYIPSGMISVLFGISPMLTGLLAARFLNEDALSPMRLIGMAVGLVGLLMIFGANGDASQTTLLGIAATIFAVLSQASSTVWVKALDHPMSALSMTTGTLLYSLPMFGVAWLVLDPSLPETVTARALGATLYLAVAGSAFGWVLYFYILKRIRASRLALVTLVTPVCALLIGALFNGEEIGRHVWIGTATILAGLAVYQWGHRLGARRTLAPLDTGSTEAAPANLRETA